MDACGVRGKRGAGSPHRRPPPAANAAVAGEGGLRECQAPGAARGSEPLVWASALPGEWRLSVTRPPARPYCSLHGSCKNLGRGETSANGAALGLYTRLLVSCGGEQKALVAGEAAAKSFRKNNPKV